MAEIPGEIPQAQNRGISGQIITHHQSYENRKFKIFLNSRKNSRKIQDLSSTFKSFDRIIKGISL